MEGVSPLLERNSCGTCLPRSGIDSACHRQAGGKLSKGRHAIAMNARTAFNERPCMHGSAFR